MTSQLPGAYAMADSERVEAASRLPRCVFIEVTNRCNLRCQTCPRTFTPLEEPRTLAWSDFLHVAGQFPETERAVLHGIGEPLLNPYLPRMVAHLKRRGSTVLFNTNGTLLDERKAAGLIDSGLDELRVSVDAANLDTYCRIRGKPLLGLVMANVARFVRLRRERQAGLPRISLWLTGTAENVSEFPKLVELAAGAEVREVYLQRLVYILDAPSPPGMMSARYALAAEKERVKTAIAEAEARARELGVALHASGATDPRNSLDLEGHGERPWARCARPWTTAYVTANGNCLPCCMGPFATIDYARLRMGNLFDQDFAQIWNSGPYMAWRRAMMNDNAPVPCTGCGVHWSL